MDMNYRFTHGPDEFRFVGAESSDSNVSSPVPFDVEYSNADVTGPRILLYHDMCLMEAAYERARKTYYFRGNPPGRWIDSFAKPPSYTTQMKRWAVAGLADVKNGILKGLSAGGDLLSWTGVIDHVSYYSNGADLPSLPVSAYSPNDIQDMSDLISAMDKRRTVLAANVTSLADRMFTPDAGGLYMVFRSSDYHASGPPWPFGSGDTVGSGRFAQYMGYSRVYTPGDGSPAQTDIVADSVLTGDPVTVPWTVDFPSNAKLTPGDVSSMLDTSEAYAIIEVTWPSVYGNTSNYTSWWRYFWSSHTQYMNGRIRTVSVPAALRFEQGGVFVDVTVSPGTFNGILETHKFNGSDSRTYEDQQGNARVSSVTYTNAWRCDMGILGVAVKYNPRERPVT